jgi:hypothetical protein
MKELFEKTTTTEHFRVICDFFGRRQDDSWRGFDYCAICKKLTCYKCGEFFYEGGSDHHSKAGCPEHKEQIRKAYRDYDDAVNSVPDIDAFIRAVK